MDPRPLSGTVWPLRITPDDVGKRVSVRLTAGHVGGRQQFTDVVGELVRWSERQLVVRNRDGRLVEIGEDTLVAGKVVPPTGLPRRRRPGAAAAPPTDEDAEANASYQAVAAVMEGLAARTAVSPDHEQLGAWLLSAAQGRSPGANCVIPLGDPALFGGPELGLDAAIARVQDWYAARDRPARFQLVVDCPLDRELEQRGWRAEGETLFMTGHLPHALSMLPAGHVRSEEVRITDRPSAAWLRFHRGAGQSSAPIGSEVASPQRVRYAEFRAASAEDERVEDRWAEDEWADADETPEDEAAEALAVGRATIDGDWASLADVEVSEQHRRRGYSQAIMRALLLWAEDAGAKEVFLRVESGNLAAVALYEKLGFTEHHRYHYRTL